jgi:hypothetical protein
MNKPHIKKTDGRWGWTILKGHKVPWSLSDACHHWCRRQNRKEGNL